MEISLLVAQIYSIILLASGLSLLVRTKEWATWAQEFKEQPSGTVGLGLAILPFALILVLTHSIWVWAPVVIISIMGWILFIDAIILLLVPNVYKLLNFSDSFILKVCKIKGIILTIIGGFLSYYMFFML